MEVAWRTVAEGSHGATTVAANAHVRRTRRRTVGCITSWAALDAEPFSNMANHDHAITSVDLVRTQECHCVS